MAFRVRDIHTVHNNQLNKSVSKQLYTIPKADRFKRCHTVISDKYYDIPSTNELKAAPIGRAGRKSIFDIKEQRPSPAHYNVADINIEVKNIIFPHGREECKLDGFLQQKLKTPGPGAYDPNPQNIFKTTSQNERKKKNDTPGPGSYPLRSTWLENQKFLSTQKKIGCTLIRNSKFKRMLCQGQSLDTPFYYPKQSRNGGQTFNKSGGFSIGKSLRFKERTKTESDQPGPGSYAQFSEFI